MKKNGIFKILCLVLAVALLSPHVFAATPAPEAPLADAATVARVKQEIANGEITDMEDVFLVAYQHLGADIEEDGMTAYINEDGTLGITQIILNTNSDTSLCSLPEGSTEKTIAVMTLGSYDNQGRLLADYTYETHPFYGSSSDSEGAVNVTHAMYITAGYDEMIGLMEVQLNRISTTIVHTTPNYVSSALVQEYTILGDGFGFSPVQGSRTIAGPSTGTHTYYPGETGRYNPSSGNLGGSINTSSTVSVTNIEAPIHIDLQLDFDDIERWFDLSPGGF